MLKLFKLLLLIFSILPIALFSNGLIVNRVDFEGNIAFNNSELARIVVTQPGDSFSQKVLNGDVKRISNYYADSGYFDVFILPAELATSSSNEVGVTFIIDEQSELPITKIEINGNRYISNSKLEEATSFNNLKLKDIPNTLQSLVDFYTQNGFLFASVKLDSLAQNESGYQVTLNIVEGDFCEFSDVRFKGNKVSTELSLLKISQLNSMKKITPDFLKAAEENIRRKSYINECQIFPLNSHQLLVEIEEGRMNRFSGILGYDNTQDSENKLTGFLDFEFLNLYGTDRSLALQWQKLQANSSSIELSYHESGLNNFPVNGDLTLYREEADSTYINSKLETEVYYYTLYQLYGIYYALETYYPGSRRPKLIETSTYHKIGGFWEYDDTDYALNPRKGSFINFKYYYIIDQKKGSDSDKQAVESSYKKYWSLNNRVVLFSGINASYMENKNLKDYENFDLGGSKNLRGFMEKQFYGHRILWTNLELRYLVNRKSRFFLFSDYGYAENNEYTNGKIFGFGGGMRLETRIGLLGIDYGFGYSNGEWRNPMDGIIHFGLEANL